MTPCTYEKLYTAESESDAPRRTKEYGYFLPEPPWNHTVAVFLCRQSIRRRCAPCRPDPSARVASSAARISRMTDTARSTPGWTRRGTTNTAAIRTPSGGMVRLGCASARRTSRRIRYAPNADGKDGLLLLRNYIMFCRSHAAAPMTRTTSWGCANRVIPASPRWKVAAGGGGRLDRGLYNIIYIYLLCTVVPRHARFRAFKA